MMTATGGRRMATVLLALAGLLLAVPGWTADALPVKPFKARYSGFALLKLKPVDLSFKSSMELALTDSGNGRYRIDSLIKGLIGTITSQVEGELHGDVLHPLFYQQVMNIIKASQTQATFDWPNKTVATRENDEQRDLPLTEGVVDPLSLYLLAMWDLQAGRKPRQYTLVSGVRLKTYKATLEGEESLQTPVGKVRALRIVSKRDKEGNEGDSTILWFAPEWNYMPVQLVRIEDGKEMLRMTLQEINAGAR